jgi:hypothetical protein
MDMHVIGNTGPGSGSEVHAQIETCRRVNFPQRLLPALGKIHELVRYFLWNRVKFAGVQIRNNEQMSGDVRIEIQYNIRMLSAMKDEISLVIFRIVCDEAKDAAISL